MKKDCESFTVMTVCYLIKKFMPGKNCSRIDAMVGPVGPIFVESVSRKLVVGRAAIECCSRFLQIFKFR